MSYDIHLEIDTGGSQPAVLTEIINPTYNLAPMFAEALGVTIRTLDGMTAAAVLPIIVAGLARMEAEPALHKAMNPPNGWGDYDGAVETLVWLRNVCQAHPKATVRI